MDDTRTAPPADGTRTAAYADGTHTAAHADSTRTGDPDGTHSYGTAANTAEALAFGEELGRGAMGVVFKATQAGTNRTVAVKTLLDGADDPRRAIRFLAEAEAVAAVDHPNVVKVFEFGSRDGKPFLAMEYLAGGSLAERLKDGKLAPRAAAELVGKLAAGVDAAHALGIIHRDLKPGNVLFDSVVSQFEMGWGLFNRRRFKSSKSANTLSASAENLKIRFVCLDTATSFASPAPSSSSPASVVIEGYASGTAIGRRSNWLPSPALNVIQT